jgi:hypothetical protein
MVRKRRRARAGTGVLAGRRALCPGVEDLLAPQLQFLGSQCFPLLVCTRRPSVKVRGL